MNYTLVTCHFGDPFWIRHSLARVDALSDSRIERVVVVDQDRGSSDWLARLPRVSDVLTFPIDADQESYFGCDHPSSLNRALQSIDVDTSHVLVLDSDCFPIRDGWLDQLSEVTLATEPAYQSLSHPCLMAFPAESRAALDFSEGIAELGMDAGRLVSAQLLRLGYSVKLSPPVPAFRGYRGHFYLDGHVYHYGHGSFPSSGDGRLYRQVDLYREALFRRHVESDEFDLTAGEIMAMRGRGAIRRFRGALAR